MNTAYATLLLIATAVYILFIVVTYTMLVFVFVAIKNSSSYLSSTVGFERTVSLIATLLMAQIDVARSSVKPISGFLQFL